MLLLPFVSFHWNAIPLFQTKIFPVPHQKLNSKDKVEQYLLTVHGKDSQLDWQPKIPFSVFWRMMTQKKIYKLWWTCMKPPIKEAKKLFGRLQFRKQCSGHKIKGAGLAQGWEHSPPTDVAWVWFWARTICRLGLWLVLSLVREVFPSPKKPALQNSNLTWNARTLNTWASGSGEPLLVLSSLNSWFDFF